MKDLTALHMKILHIHTKLGLGIKLIACTDSENVPCTTAEGLRYHKKIGRGSHVVLLKSLTHVVLIKIFDAELQCGDSEQALIHFSVSPSSVKHQSHGGGCGNFGENAPRKLRKRGYTPQHRCAPLSRDYHQPHEK